VEYYPRNISRTGCAATGLWKIGHGLAILLGLNLLLAETVRAADQAGGPSGAETIHDASYRVTWLANANLAATEKFGVANISPGGAMDYPTALAWVAAMNARNYLGHNNWTLPATPAIDKGCGSKNLRGGGYFGFNCTLSAMGSLYANFLNYRWPRTIVPVLGNKTGPFGNLQPNLYWTDQGSGKTANGYGTFSFNTGAQMENVDKNYLYVLPMIAGKLPGTPPAAGTGLQVNPDGKTVYDPVADVTWAADANLAATDKFDVPLIDRATGVANFSPSGAMTHTAALAWIAALNSGSGYAGQKNWQLPPMAVAPIWNRCQSANPVSGCAGNPLGELFYNQLHGGKGRPVTPLPDVNVGAFRNLQPYLYWSCGGDRGENTCSTADPLPAPGFGWSFDFGDGFQGTDRQPNYLYVMVYYPD